MTTNKNKESEEKAGCDLKMKMVGEDNLGDNTPSSHPAPHIESDGGAEIGSYPDNYVG